MSVTKFQTTPHSDIERIRKLAAADHDIHPLDAVQLLKQMKRDLALLLSEHDRLTAERDEAVKRAEEFSEATFQDAWNAMADQVGRTATEKGFWDDTQTDTHYICMMHGELSEAMEAIRAGNAPDKHIPDLNSAEVEFADVVIRIMDYAGKKGYRVGEAIVKKAAYNATRPYKHGKAF